MLENEIIDCFFVFVFLLSILNFYQFLFHISRVIKQCNTRHTFFLAALTNECVAAIGSAATDTAALAIVAQVFPSNVAKMIVSIKTICKIFSVLQRVFLLLSESYGGFVHDVIINKSCYATMMGGISFSCNWHHAVLFSDTAWLLVGYFSYFSWYKQSQGVNGP